MKDLEAYLDAASALSDLPIAEAHRPGVLQFLAIAAEMAAALDKVSLDDDELALAPVYAPPEISGEEGA